MDKHHELLPIGGSKSSPGRVCRKYLKKLTSATVSTASLAQVDVYNVASKSAWQTHSRRTVIVYDKVVTDEHAPSENEVVTDDIGGFCVDALVMKNDDATSATKIMVDEIDSCSPRRLLRKC